MPETTQQKERALDWLTALVPLFLISLYYYRLSALFLEITTLGGYLMAEVLLKKVRSEEAFPPFPTALMPTLIGAFWLPATAPWWLSAVLGGVCAVIEELPGLLHRKWEKFPARSLVFPPVAGVVIVYAVFSSLMGACNAPVPWRGLEAVTGATPLATMSSAPQPWWQLFFGIQAGCIGGTCVVAVLFGTVFLLIRRRVRWIAPLVMLVTVSGLSWAYFGWHFYSVLAGETVLTALMLGDTAYMPGTAKKQIFLGLTAGVFVVAVRVGGIFGNGNAIGLLIAQLTVWLLPFLGKGEQFLRHTVWLPVWRTAKKWGKAGWNIIKNRLKLKKSEKNC